VHLQLTSLNRPIKLVRQACDWLLQLRATLCLTVNTGRGLTIARATRPKRNFIYLTQDIFLTLHKSLVKCYLEYANSLQNPHRQEQIKDL